MAEGRLPTSNDEMHWSLHTQKHTQTYRGTAIEGEAANICMKRSRDVWRLSTPAALSFPAAGTYLMSCFASWRASGLAFRFSGKLKFLLGTGNDYSMAYRFILNASLASFVWGHSFSCVVDKDISWIRLLLTLVTCYFQEMQAFEALDKESLCSLEIKASIHFVFKLKNFPQGPEILENCVLGAKHLELEHRPHIHNKALELKAMWRNLQRPETGLSWSPVVTLQMPHTAPPPSNSNLYSAQLQLHRTWLRLSCWYQKVRPNARSHKCWVRNEIEVETVGYGSPGKAGNVVSCMKCSFYSSLK